MLACGVEEEALRKEGGEPPENDLQVSNVGKSVCARVLCVLCRCCADA